MIKKTFLISSVGIYSFCFSNNIQISNTALTGQDVSAGLNNPANFALVQFDISWDNSWRTSTFESNWDATWVFVKYRVNGVAAWSHATLSITGHTAPTGSTITTSTDGKGAFIYKSADGIGTNTWTVAQLRWNYGADGVLDADLLEVYVSGIEMVYIPSGAFYAGDGLTGTAQFEAGVSGAPFQVTSEAAITLGGGGAGSMGNNNATGGTPLDDFNDGTTQTLPAAYPKGFSAYYIMKYEITQEQYVEFLNKLTYNQQVTRTAVAPNSAAGTGALSNTFRNGVDIMTPGVSATTPAVYACNLDGDGIYDETNDGQNIACNFLSWDDFAAYLDWSGLRPFTELEYEKACRGTLASAAGEFAWGNVTITAAATITAGTGGFANETTSTAGANSVWNSGVGGPMRVGNFAQAATTRTASGGSYYGVMELSANIWERVITVGNAASRTFTGSHGDGAIDATTGNANVTFWPTGSGSGLRGGACTSSGTTTLRVSDRQSGGGTSTGRSNIRGGRGARSAP